MSDVNQEEIALLRQRIVRLEAQVDYLYKHLNVTFVENSFETDDDPRVIAALREHKMIEAIKYYRETTGLGLAAAKTACEAIQARLGI